MENQDSLTPTQYGKMVGMFPDPPHNPLPTGGYMDAGFDWVVHQAEAVPISEEEELLVVRNNMGQTKGFIEMEEDLEDDSIEIEISDDEMEEIAEITLDAESEDIEIVDIDWETDGEDVDLPSSVRVPSDLEEDEIADYLSDNYGFLVNGFVMGAETFGAERSDDGIVYVDEDNSIRLAKGSKWMQGSGGMEDYYVDGCNSCHRKLDGYKTQYVVSPRERWAYCMECFDQMKGREDAIVHVAETDSNAETAMNAEMVTCAECGMEIDEEDIIGDGTNRGLCCVPDYYDAESKSMFSKDKNGKMYARRRNGEIITHNADFVKPSRDWFSLALGTAAVVIGGSLFLQNRSMFKADGDEMAPVGTGEPSLVAHPSTGDLLPADYEEMIVESTGYAVPIIPVSLDPAFMGSRFHALPTDRTVESNEPGIGAHTDVAMTRDTDFREPEQSMITRFNADGENCECSLLERIKSFFTGKSCCEGKEVKEANSVTGQTPYFGVGFDGKNTQTRVIKETNPISLDPSTAPYIPQNLSGYTGQAYTPPTVYSDMMNIGVSGQNPAFVSTQSSSLQSVHGNLSAGMNQSYTDGSRTMSLSQWSIDYDVSQTSDSEAFAVSRSSGVRTMIRRV